MDFWYFDENINEWKVDLDKFIESLGNLNDITSFNLMIRISSLKEEDISRVLKRDDIRNKLAIGLLEESKRDFYAGFRRILAYFTPEQFLSLYDVKTLKAFFTGDLKGHEYKFFATLLENNINRAIKYVLNNDEMFDELFKLGNNYYSVFPNISYDLFRDVILKMGNNISSYPGDFINIVSSEYQRNILKENISDEMLLYLVPRFKDEIISEFFSDDPRARYLFDKFNIKNFVSRGIKFNDEIVKKKEFFDCLKSESFVAFRTNINEAEKNNNIDIIERRLNDYYDEIISSYDSSSRLFKEYFELINNPNFKISQGNISFIMDSEIAMNLNRYKGYDDEGNRIIKNKERLKIYLAEVTSRKLSEVIIDALFEDNIYNVWLNIKEMLRYNNKLSGDMKVIDKTREEFYNTILNIDNISSEEKINLFHGLRDKRVNFMFYDDLRKLKDLSYDLIKKELFSVEDKKNDVNLNNELSNKYGIKVYDLRDKEYTMLIRGQYSYREKSGYRRNCYSIIGSENSDVYGHADGNLVYYGYNSFENDRVIHVLEQDSFSGDIKNELPSRYVNRIMTADELVRNSSWYSEIDLVNVKNDDDEYNVKRPDYVVHYDNEESDIMMSAKEAERLNIPLVIIREKRLDKDNKLDIPFSQEEDYYIDYNDKRLEEIRNGRGRM